MWRQFFGHLHLSPIRYRSPLNVAQKVSSSWGSLQQALEQTITDPPGSPVARAQGKKHHADIVIWGWYGVEPEAASLSVNFEVLRPSPKLPEFGPTAKGELRVMALSELESFTLQTNLSSELAYLSLFTTGMVRYAAQDWGSAIARFTDALA